MKLAVKKGNHVGDIRISHFVFGFTLKRLIEVGFRLDTPRKFFRARREMNAALFWFDESLRVK